METMKVATINRTYTNWGAHCEQALAFTLTGEIRKHDHVPFDIRIGEEEPCSSLICGICPTVLFGMRNLFDCTFWYVESVRLYHFIQDYR